MKQGIEKILDTVKLMAPQNLSYQDLSDSVLNSYVSNINEEMAKIRKELIGSVFEISNEADVEFVVQNYQSILIKLLDELYSFKSSKSNRRLRETYKIVYDCLSEHLFFIEKYFSRYFDIDEKVPDVYYDLNKQELRKKFFKLKVLFEQQNVEPALVDSLLLKFEKSSVTHEKNSISYRNLIYLKELLNEISNTIESSKGDDLNIKIQQLLFYLNYNDPSFISYIISNLSRSINSLESIQEKVLLLKFQLKEINQINSRPGVGMHLDLMSAKEQIASWIEEEINYLHSQSNVFKAATVAENNPVEFKINTSLSVPQLACIIRLLVEEKIIINTNQSDILRFASTNITTIKRESISYAHLRGQYYKPELSAIEFVKNLLLKLVNLTRKIR